METYTLGCPAEEMYNHLTTYRQQVIDKGREMARITIPSVFPPEGYHTGDRIGTNNQSVGALCIGTLASKLMLMAFSPSRPILKYQVIEHKLQKDIDQQPTLWGMVQEALSKVEIEHRNRLQATQIRSQYVGAIKALLVGGNICWDHIKINTPRFHLPTNYVVKRNNVGEPLLTIVLEDLDYMDLDDDVRDLCDQLYGQDQGWAEKKDYERCVRVYRVCRRVVDDRGKISWDYWEETKGTVIEGTETTVDDEESPPPLNPAWLIPMPGHNWGRSYCEEYEGDLYRVEKLEEAVNDGAAIASLLWLFLAPGARTSMRQLKQAENLALLVGSAQDVQAGPDLGNKMRDFEFADKAIERTIQRLGRAFLLVSSVQRQAERVTAEEWALMAKEIDEAMGGLYSELGQSFQTAVIRRFVALHEEEDKGLPKLPTKYFRVAVISAIDVLGREAEGQALAQSTGLILTTFKEEAAPYIDVREFIRRIYTSAAVPQEGLVKDEQTVQANQQQMMKQSMMQQVVKAGAGPAAQAIAKAGPQALQAAQQQQANAPDGSEPPSPQDAQQVSQ